jgi:tripartite-type tricarboxylate transporter receptor subunit TctC
MTQLILSAEPGSLFDRAGRALGAAFERAAGGPLGYQNAGDSSGVGGAEAGARAPKDGSTLLVCNKGAVTSHPHTAKTYRPEDFSALCQFAEAPIGIAVGRNSPYKTLRELFEAAHEKPDHISFSTPNPYHTQRLALVSFSLKQGIQFKFIVLPGGNPAAIQKTVEGTIDFAFLAVHNYITPVKSGDLRILGVAHGERVPFLPEAPTCKEQGFDFVTAIWLGLFCPAGVPKQRYDELARTAGKLGKDPELTEAISKLNMVFSFLDSGAFQKKVAADSDFHRGVLQHLRAI